ncbi:MAG: hypothetical protein Q9192_008764, partial [Flavoplaca navasiana]
NTSTLRFLHNLLIRLPPLPSLRIPIPTQPQPPPPQNIRHESIPYAPIPGKWPTSHATLGSSSEIGSSLLLISLPSPELG